MNNKMRRQFVSGTLVFFSLLLFALTFIPGVSNVYGLLNLRDAPQGLPDLDNRVGSVAPTAVQLSAVESLGARANWNRFGTVHTLLKDGGFLATGYAGKPVSAAREWIRANRDLFRLSDQAVTDLELVSEGPMPHSAAHAVLFRQRFGGLAATQDGLINVAIVDGNVYHVWSSSAGDQAAPGAATLTPVQAWIAAAANVNQIVPPADVLSARLDKHNNWTVLKVTGFLQDQQVRLTALPTPTDGVRSAYEANVVNVKGHIAEAYTVFVDAQTGEILYRVNRVNWFAAGAPEAPAAPITEVFSGVYSDLPATPACGPRHPFPVGPGIFRLVVFASAAIESNDIVLKLYFADPVLGDQLLVSGDTGTSPETVTYEPLGGVPVGTYKVEVCPFVPPTAPAVPPYNYAGTFTADDSPVPGTGIPYPPKWKYFQANPLLDYSSTDVRNTGCWEAVVLGAPIPGCDHTLRNLAARAPWDYDFRAGTFTSTMRGNAAQTTEAWGSPLTPTTQYAPTSASREYIYPWANDWKTSGATGKGCDPTILVHTGGAMPDADIDAAITHLFVTHNRLHDWSYFLGFTEQNSNLQLDNFGNTQPSRQNDPEIGNAQAGAVSGGPNGMYLGRDNANQITLQDGVPGITNQYLFQPIAAAFYSPCVDGDMDAPIVGHEYTHAISNRMVAGPDAGISGAQGGAMGEGWSDLNAAEYLFSNGFVPTADEEPSAGAAYATQNKTTGIRNYSPAINPLNYGNVGYDTPGPQVHADGEIWNGTNWEIRQALIDKYNAQYPYTDMVRQKDCADGKYAADACPGNRRWIQLVYDAWLLQPGATSMLDARDAMLAADVARFGGANQVELWRAFSKRGMGIDAFTNGSDDGTPIPNFDSPVESNEATITFQATAQDEGNAALTNAKIIVGHFQTRSRAIADTDPATVVDNTNATTRRMTLNRSDTAKFIPGTYDLIVQAPGYGIQRFTRTFTANQTATVSFAMPTNRASLAKGATVTTTATDPADIAAKNNLIDDTEDTGARLGSVAPVAGKSITVDLAGGTPLMVTSVNVSTAAGPSNAGRFTGVRKFEIRTCNGICADPVANFTNVAFTSADDAFPADVPRPVQPKLNSRSFALTTPTLATHVQLRVLTTQCTGQPKYAGDQDDDPFNNSDCTSSATGAIVRATEFEVFTSIATNLTSAVSRKTHGAAGTFDVNLPLAGSPGIECRNNGSNTHQVVFRFGSPTTFSSATVTPAAGHTASVASTSTSGNDVIVNLTNVSNAQTVTISLLNVNGTAATFAVQMGVLTGDTNANRAVNASDISQTKADSGDVTDASNFREDVNVNGVINASDISSVKSKSGTSLPP
jgi:hypothetical protein